MMSNPRADLVLARTGHRLSAGGLLGSAGLGRIALATDDHAAAAAELTAALKTSMSMGAGLGVARNRLALAELATASVDSAGAARHLREAHQRFARDAGQAYVERAEALAAALRVGLDGVAARVLSFATALLASG